MTAEFTVWLTGLPSSGKSTLARLVETEVQRRGFPVAVLDGDEVRTWLTAGLGFTRADRAENIRRIAHLATFLNRAGMVAITAAISPHRDSRAEARALIGRFVEVHVDCPLAVCEERDVKGLYKKARRGEVARFTGVSDAYEPPVAPEVVVRTDVESKEACVRRIMERVEALGYVPQGLVRREIMVPAGAVNRSATRAVPVLFAGASRTFGPNEGAAALTAEECQRSKGA